MRSKGIDRLALVVDYELGLTTRAVAAAHGCTHGYVSQALKAAGVVTHRRRVFTRRCAQCRKQTRQERFCSRGCYYAAIHNPQYVQWRQGQRRARAAVLTAGFPLEASQVVHHVDGNNRNNQVGNLWVFATKGHHMSFHRLGREMMERRAVWKCGVVMPVDHEGDVLLSV
jgi:hypothetical protein